MQLIMRPLIAAIVALDMCITLANACYIEKRDYVVKSFGKDAIVLTANNMDNGVAYKTMSPQGPISVAMYDNYENSGKTKTIIRTRLGGKSLVMFGIQIDKFFLVHVVASANEQACELPGLPPLSRIGFVQYTTM
jgi:hypothetical protein